MFLFVQINSFLYFCSENATLPLKKTLCYKGSSKTNSNSIFLPAAGYHYDSSLSSEGSSGYYRSSSLCESGPTAAWNVYYYTYFQLRYDYHNRYYGQSVRPVCP